VSIRSPDGVTPNSSEPPLQSPLIVPDLRRTVRHAVPNIIEGKVVPLALFLAAVQLASTAWALGVSLAWSLGSLAYRKWNAKPVPALIVLSTITLTARTAVALATGSLVVYFLQPTLTTAAVGVAFLVSVPLGMPLAQRLAFDLMPFDEHTKRHPLVRSFFVRMSLLWAATSLVNAAITVWLLLESSTTTFVVVKSVLGPGTAVVTIGLMLVWLRFAVARTGTALVWSRAATRPA